MAQNTTKDAEGWQGAISEVFQLLREHHSDIAGVKKDVDTMGGRLNSLAGKVDEVLEAVTRHSARQGPGLLQMLGVFAMLLGIAGGLSTGIAIFVGSMYDSKIVSIEGDAAWARHELAQRNAEDRAELVELRRARAATFDERLAKIEERAGGWAPSKITRGP